MIYKFLTFFSAAAGEDTSQQDLVLINLLFLVSELRHAIQRCHSDLEMEQVAEINTSTIAYQQSFNDCDVWTCPTQHSRLNWISWLPPQETRRAAKCFYNLMLQFTWPEIAR